MAKKCYQNTVITLLNNCYSKESIVTLLRHATFQNVQRFYADRYTTFRNVAQFFAQIVKPRSRTSNRTWRSCAADNRGDQRDSMRQTLSR